jgi:hypothetical protein
MVMYMLCIRSSEIKVIRFQSAKNGLIKKTEGGALVTSQEWRRWPFCSHLSSPSQTLRLTPLTSALRAARAHDAVLRMYPDLPLCFIKIHGDILVSYAYDEDFELRNEVTVTFPIEGIFQNTFAF